MKSNQRKSQHVIIKGTKDGLTFLLDDQCSIETLKEELQKTLSDRPESANESVQHVNAKLVVGKRYLDRFQIEELESLFSEEMNVTINEIESEVISKEEAEEMKQNMQVTRVVKVIRSGQVLDFKGDLLLIGDVNPGGTVKATGNIYIMGSLKGIAHAGSQGNEEAIICAAEMKPSQLRIASMIRRPPEQNGENSGFEEGECAYLNEDKEMVLDKLQILSKIRPGLSMEI